MGKEGIEEREVRVKGCRVYIGWKIFEWEYVRKGLEERGEKKVIVEKL